MHLIERRGRCNDVADAEPDRHRVHRLIRERNVNGVTPQETDAGVDLMANQLGLTVSKHLGRKIHPDHASGAARKTQRQREIGRAGAQVQHRLVPI